MNLSDEQVERMSTPAIAFFTRLRDNGEPYPREQFLQEFPGVDYDATIQELINEGINPQLSIPTETPRGVLFKAGNRATRYSLEFH